MVSLHGLMIALILSINQPTLGYPTIDSTHSDKGRFLNAFIPVFNNRKDD